MEVLISVFILSVGLMGLLALIPIGTIDVLEAVKADRGSSAGRAVNHDVKVRRMCYPAMWMNHMQSDDPIMLGNATSTQTWWDLDDLREMNPDSPVEEGHSICIDPLFIAKAHAPFGSTGSLPASWPGRAFPYYLDNDPAPAAAGMLGPVPMTTPAEPPRMTRVSLRSWPSTWAPMMSFGLADRIFSWQDDLIFNLPTDGTLRPEIQPSDVGRGQSTGNYTWMATLTPADGQADVLTTDRRLYNYSVVVFYKRNLNPPVANPASVLANDPYYAWRLADRSVGPPSERIVFADLLTPGVSFGGGDVRLRLLTNSALPNSDPNAPEQSDFTKLRPGNWILLSGILVPSGGEHRSVFQWYRVVALGDGPTLWDPSHPTDPQPTPSMQPEWVRDVTLAGPDWQPGPFQDVDGVATYGTLYATLIEGVVAVYTRTIELDTWSGW